MAKQTDREFIDKAMEVARGHQVVMDGLSVNEARKYVRKVIKTAEVVYALWQEGGRVHLYCIKGNTLAEGTELAGVRTAAFFVPDSATAEALKQVQGDSLPTRAVN